MRKKSHKSKKTKHYMLGFLATRLERKLKKVGTNSTRSYLAARVKRKLNLKHLQMMNLSPL